VLCGQAVAAGCLLVVSFYAILFCHSSGLFVTWCIPVTIEFVFCGELWSCSCHTCDELLIKLYASKCF